MICKCVSNSYMATDVEMQLENEKRCSSSDEDWRKWKRQFVATGPDDDVEWIVNRLLTLINLCLNPVVAVVCFHGWCGHFIIAHVRRANGKSAGEINWNTCALISSARNRIFIAYCRFMFAMSNVQRIGFFI